jgi:sec-independent protein translocase protein TatB
VFNLQGSEIIFILLLALVVLGPEKLPGAIKKATQTYNELRKMSSGFQSEFKSAIDEPMREMRATADLIMEQADPKKIAEAAERSAAVAAEVDPAEADGNVDGADPEGGEADADVAEGEVGDVGAVEVGAVELGEVEVGEVDDPFDDPLEESA